MNGKELLAHFKAAAFRNADEVRQFADSAGDVAAADVLKLLEAVPGRPGDPRLRALAFQRVAEKLADRSLFAPYLRALRTADPALRGTLVELLPKVNSVSDHPTLLTLLRAPDAALRQAAAQVLGAVGGKIAFDGLAEMMREQNFLGRSEAIDAVMAMAPQHAVPALAAALAAGNAAEKAKAINAIVDPRCAGKDPTAALRALQAALNDSSEAVAAAALGGLARLATEEAYFESAAAFLDAPSVPLARAALEGLRRFPGPRAAAALHRRLRLGPNALRLVAVEGLEAIGTPDVLEPLVEALGHLQLNVRQRAGEALMHLGKEGALDLARTVIFLLRSRDVNVRRMAVELVQTVKDPAGELWPKLLGYLRDEDWWVRERVMDALADMAGEALLRHLVAFLNDPNELLRRFAVDALMRLRSPLSLGALVRTAGNDPDWWVRERAIEAVGAIKDLRAAPHVVQLMRANPQLQIACLQALGEMGASVAAPRVAELLSSEDGDVQFAALRCLAVLNDPAQSSAAQGLLRDHRTEVRSLARELVGRWGEDASGPALVVDEPVPVLDQLLIALDKAEGDDMILAPGRRPLMKRLGRTVPLAQTVFNADRVRALLAPHLSARQMMELDEGREVDFSYRVETADLRFRVNVFHQLGGLGAVFRIIKASLPDLDALGLPGVVKGLADLPSGLVLVGGATGSGKSTTLAALIDHINRTSRRHVVTLEDPIEVVHPRKQSLVNQREVGTHTGSFEGALRATLRQDPDVILVGELRDLPTISFAITAAETGHLVFGTIHVSSAAGSIDRVINAFPPGQQDHVRAMLAGALRAVLCQFLLPRSDAPGRCLAVEVLLNNEAVANLIRKGKTFQIPSVIATSREQGMQLMDTELLRLSREGRVSVEEAQAKAISKKEFEPLLAAATAAAAPGVPSSAAAPTSGPRGAPHAAEPKRPA
jgi:twitching motility protein PilT